MEHYALWMTLGALCLLFHAGRVAKVRDTKNTYKGNRGGVERFPGFSAAVPPEKEIIILTREPHGAWSMLHAACSMLHGAWGSMEHAPCFMQHGALWSMEHEPYGAWSMLHAAGSMLHGARGIMEHAPCFMQHDRVKHYGAWSMLRAACSMLHGAWGIIDPGGTLPDFPCW